MEIRAPEQATTTENPLSDEVVIEQIRSKMFNAFLGELRVLQQILPSIKVKALAEMKSLVQERRELAGLRKKIGNQLRYGYAGAKAAFERMAKGGKSPSWVWSGNVK